MKIYRLKKRNLPKVLVLATGLAAAVLAVTMSTQAAQATPRAASCAGCHGAATAGTATATPSTTATVAGASYTVEITLLANPNGGNTGYGIVPVTAGTGSTFGGNTGTQLSFTATMTAPAASGTYSYTVWTNQGITDGTARVGSVVYSITVTGGSTTAPPTTPPATTPPATTPPATTPPESLGGIHGPYTLSSAQCGTCHRAHTAKAPGLLKSVSPGNLGSQSTLCLSCHDGTVASADAGLQYALVRPANDAETREYYSHDAVGATPPKNHTLSNLDEFGGVSNRHSECADCHNAHQATVNAPRNSVLNADGWDASQRLAGVSGVSVDNGAAGSAPTYKFLSGVDTNVIPANLVTREYQLCFKCHSGSTVLPPPIADKPSKDFLDKGVEFNPANPSFHPVEAAGTNTTAAMAASLAGASTDKLWDFKITDTIRCLSCHASSDTPATPLPLPGSALAPHTSSNRGILIRNYRDRVLKPAVDVLVDGVVVDKAAYDAGDFALCYVCHGQAPFAPGASSSPAALLQTNFSLHSQHLTELEGKGGTGTDIDTAGNGGGNAVCAECHFRLHSTTNKVGVPGNTRLVSFAPNVQPNNGTLSYTAATTAAPGSCTLTCHGHPHTAIGQQYPALPAPLP